MEVINYPYLAMFFVFILINVFSIWLSSYISQRGKDEANLKVIEKMKKLEGMVSKNIEISKNNEMNYNNFKRDSLLKFHSALIVWYDSVCQSYLSKPISDYQGLNEIQLNFMFQSYHDFMKAKSNLLICDSDFAEADDLEQKINEAYLVLKNSTYCYKIFLESIRNMYKEDTENLTKQNFMVDHYNKKIKGENMTEEDRVKIRTLQFEIKTKYKELFEEDTF